MEEEGDRYCWMMWSVMVMRGHCWSVSIQLLENTTVGIMRTLVLSVQMVNSLQMLTLCVLCVYVYFRIRSVFKVSTGLVSL